MPLAEIAERFGLSGYASAGASIRNLRERLRTSGASLGKDLNYIARSGNSSSAPQYSDAATYQGFTSDLSINSPSTKAKLNPNAILMYVRADRPLYLRGKVFDTFMDDHWSNGHPETEKLDVEMHHVDLRIRSEPNRCRHWSSSRVEYFYCQLDFRV